MRATSMRRLIGGAAALMLVGTTLLIAAGSALGADTRKMYIGPDPDFTTGNGTLAFTPVTAGGDTLSTIYVKNIDNQTLTHVVITIDKSQNGATVSGQILGPDKAKCDGTIDPITCDFGNLKADATRQFSIIITTPAGTGDVLAKIVFNESNNPKGGNQQIESAHATPVVGDATCNTLATFLPPGIAKSLLPDTGKCSTDTQRSGLIVPAATDGNVVSVDDGTAATGCATGYSCFGNSVNANVNGGASVSPYLSWTIFYANSVIGSISPTKVGFDHDGFVIVPGKKGACKTDTSTNCIESITVTSDGVTFVVRTPTNGLIKGVH
jgi:hypothetical protein